MASLSIDRIAKFYGSHEVIRSISLDISDGEFVTLVGPSGCGKSTLLRMIAGLESISGGLIRIGDRVVNTVQPKERDIAMVFQNYALYPHMTVAENMSFALRLKGQDKATIARRVAEAASILALEPYLERLPKQLSGGQRQRVAMGRAIVRDPQVFLFDEPLSNLDAKLRVQMRSEIKDLHQRLRTTTVYVTHDQVEAMTMADRIVVMKGGNVEQVGRPLELYDHPANLFVATFIGSPAMNLFEGTPGEGGFATDGGVLPLPSAAGAAAARTWGIRPENLRLAEAGIAAEVVVVEPTGAETQVIARVGKQQIVAVLRERVELSPGDTIRLAPDLGAVHLFDAAGSHL